MFYSSTSDLYTEPMARPCARFRLAILRRFHYQPPGHPEHVPWPHPQQLETPTPQLRRTSVMTLTSPSPSTNPLAITISVMSLPPPLDCRRVLHVASITPPISLAIVNEGVFRKPIANATPEGKYFVNLDRPCAQYTFPADMRPKTIAKMIMKMPLFSGRFPSPILWSEYDNNWMMSGNLHEVTERGLTRYMPWVLETKARVSRIPWCKCCMRLLSRRWRKWNR
jgi:hypothetical protein